MTWRERLLGLALAGGLIASCEGTQPQIPGGPCNANPDPCCSDPNGIACFNEHHPDAAVDASTDGEPPDAEAD
jgi:hypothetical protein